MVRFVSVLVVLFVAAGLAAFGVIPTQGTGLGFDLMLGYGVLLGIGAFVGLLRGA